MSKRGDDTSVECILPGNRIQLPIVRSLASLHSRNASRITWHSHDVYELLYLLDGATEYEFSDGQTVVLPGGHFLIVPPKMRHRGMHNVRRPARLCSIQLNTKNSLACSNTVFTADELDWIFQQFERGTFLAWPMGTELRKLAKMLANQVRTFNPSQMESAATLRLTVCGTLLEMARQLCIARTIPPDEAVRAAISHMETQFCESLSMDDIAMAIKCSRARLFSIFKHATGLTPNDYLQRLRVSKAAAMLQETDRSITEIAMLCGFNTSQYFSNVFRKYHDRTPSDFRVVKPNRKKYNERF